MLTIKVESTPGTEIKDCLAEMCVLSKKLHVYVTQHVNGIIVVARPDTDPVALGSRYNQARVSGLKVVS